MAEPNTPDLAVGAATDAEADRQQLLTPRLAPATDEVLPLKCCCGSAECVYLRHSKSVLDTVEKDVHTAARMGQVSFAGPRLLPSAAPLRSMAHGKAHRWGFLSHYGIVLCCQPRPKVPPSGWFSTVLIDRTPTPAKVAG